MQYRNNALQPPIFKNEVTLGCIPLLTSVHWLKLTISLNTFVKAAVPIVNCVNTGLDKG